MADEVPGGELGGCFGVVVGEDGGGGRGEGDGVPVGGGVGWSGDGGVGEGVEDSDDGAEEDESLDVGRAVGVEGVQDGEGTVEVSRE